MAALTTTEIFDDIRLKYDINYDEKADTLDVYLRETVDDIYVECGVLSQKIDTLDVASGKIVFPEGVEMIYGLFLGSQEIKPVDILRYQEMTQKGNLASNFGLVQLGSSGSFEITLAGVADGTDTVTAAYKLRKDDVTALPDTLKYVVTAGISWRYEKYDQKLDKSEYQVTWNLYNDKLKDYAIRNDKQQDRTIKTNYVNEWTEILSKL